MVDISEKTCLIFPGQGAQFAGMGKDMYEADVLVKQLFELAADSSGLDLKSILFSENTDELTKTDNLQAAMTLVNLSASLLLKKRGVSVQGCAGFSLGEFAALAESGIVSTEDVFRIVAERGKVMQKACNSLSATGTETGMMAVVGMSAEKITEALNEEGIEGVYPANHNSPVQLVLSGFKSGLDQASAVLKEKGARRVIALKVAGPFHSPLMKEAADNFDVWLQNITFNNPSIDFFSNVTAQKETDGNTIKSLCREQLLSPVRWVEEQQAIHASGYETIIECGPGKVLSGLWKSSGLETKCVFTSTVAQIDKILTQEEM